MRVLSSIKTYLLGSFVAGWNLSDRPRVFYLQTKSYLNRFILKSKPTNNLVSVGVGAERVYFRDNWFDPRSVSNVFENDYTSIDKDIFKGLSTFVDVGANLGFISSSVRHHSPGCRIVCFEPLPENAEICKKNNPGATVESLGVGAKSGTVELLVDSSGFMASSIKFRYQQDKRKLKVVSLDDYFESNGDAAPKSIDLIKIDVEGMELDVLAGAQKTLQITKRVVAEIHSADLLVKFRSIMAEHGFHEHGCIEVEKTIFICDMVRTPAS